MNLKVHPVPLPDSGELRNPTMLNEIVSAGLPRKEDESFDESIKYKNLNVMTFSLGVNMYASISPKKLAHSIEESPVKPRAYTSAQPVGHQNHSGVFNNQSILEKQRNISPDIFMNLTQPLGSLKKKNYPISQQILRL